MNLPAQPAAPDYAAANEAGIYSDISTLPTRRGIDQAARLGTTYDYVDPTTGQTRTADFTGLGDLTYAQQAADLALQTNSDLQRGQLDLRQEMVTDPATGEQVTLGELNARQTAREVQASDPQAYETRQELTGRVLGDLQGGGSNITADGAVLDAAGQVQSIGARAPGNDNRLGAIYGEANQLLRTDVNDPTTGAMTLALNKAVEDYQRGGELDPEIKRQLTNDVRAAQVAKGNYLGDAATVVEATELGKAREDRAAARLGTLLGVQQQAYGQNAALREEERAAIGQRLGTLAGLAGQDFQQGQQAYGTQLYGAGQGLGAATAAAGEQRATRNENYGRDQQQIANASSVALGAPITNQFGSLVGAQQGAVGFNPVSAAGGPTVNPNAGQSGANFAQQNFGTLSSNWGTAANIASQGNPWMSLVGNAVGAGVGAMI